MLCLLIRVLHCKTNVIKILKSYVQSALPKPSAKVNDLKKDQRYFCLFIVVLCCTTKAIDVLMTCTKWLTWILTWKDILAKMYYCYFWTL